MPGMVALRIQDWASHDDAVHTKHSGFRRSRQTKTPETEHCRLRRIMIYGVAATVVIAGYCSAQESESVGVSGTPAGR
jgi:hypothetical protein